METFSFSTKLAKLATTHTDNEKPIDIENYFHIITSEKRTILTACVLYRMHTPKDYCANEKKYFYSNCVAAVKQKNVGLLGSLIFVRCLTHGSWP